MLWLLLAALPLQGMAAVVKASCGPVHHQSLPAVVSSAVHHHAAHAGASEAHHHAGDPAVTHDPHDHAGDDSATAEASPDGHQHSFCSACAACCFGAVAPPLAVSWHPAFINSEAVVLPPYFRFTGFIPDGLERPPRHLSA